MILRVYAFSPFFMTDQHFDFDTPIDRRDTTSMKWEKYSKPDVIPMWVADMDFACAPAIVEALHRRVDHGIFGYTQPPRELVRETVAYLATRIRLAIDPDWIVWLPGLVVGLNVVAVPSANRVTT